MEKLREKFQEELRRKLQLNSDKVFYKLNDKYITYGELLERSSLLSDYLKNDCSPVVLYGHKSIEMVISIIGCILAGRCYVPVDIFTPKDRINKIIELSECSLVINNSNNDLDVLSDVEIISSIDNLPSRCECINDNEYCYMIFTSGSTGVPKGVPISYSNLYNFIEWISNIDGFKYDFCNVLNQASFSFDLSVTDFYYALFNGHTLVGSEKKLQDDLGSFLEYLKSNLIDVMVITPTFMKYLLLDKGFVEGNYPMLKSIYFCGEVLDVDVVRKIYDRFSNVKVINAYGPTEATSAVSSIVITREMLEFERLPVGEVSKCNNNIVICDKEIVIKGKSVFNGYLGGIVGGYFLENNINCYKTGDLGIIDGDYLYCLGRSDNQIKLNGYRIELEEIEKVINNIVGVNNSCVIAKRDNSGKVKCLKAYVCGEVDLDEVNSWLTSKLPSYMVPKFIEIVSSLPVNNNGKLDRKKIESL